MKTKKVKGKKRSRDWEVLNRRQLRSQKNMRTPAEKMAAAAALAALGQKRKQVYSLLFWDIGTAIITCMFY